MESSKYRKVQLRNKQLNIRTSQASFDRLHEIACLHGVSLNDLLNYMIDQIIEEEA